MVEEIKCPFCDSNAFKYLAKEIEMFLCHSCHRSTTWDFAKSFRKTSVSSKKVSTIADYSTLLSRAKTINNLPSEHYARVFCEKRKLPKTDDLFFVESLKNFLRGTKYEDKFGDSPKIIIPLRSKHGLFGVQARTLTNENPKYITIMFVDCASIYNKENIDRDDTIFVVEGPFDSMFLKNSIAVVGSGVEKIDFAGDFVFCFDNEPRNKSIMKNMVTQLRKGNKVVIWPDKIKEKDINEMVLSGIDVNSVVRQNIYEGAKGEVKLHIWKKV